MSTPLNAPALRADVRDALRAAVEERRASGERAVAVFDYDNTCIHGDIGELFGQYMVDERRYRLDLDPFWALIDPRDGRDTARALAGELAAIAPTDPAYDDVFAAYRAEMAALYTRLMAREGKASAYAWAVLLHVGLTEREMFDHSLQCVRREWARELGSDTLITRAGESATIGAGVRRIGEIREVHDWLRAHGYEVWIVSATNDWTVKVAAQEMFGHDPAFAVGNRVLVDDGVLTAQLDGAALYKEGKVAAIERYIGVQPSIVFGDSDTDLSMMQWARDLAVLMDRGDLAMREHATGDRWVTQPHAGLTLEAL